jgi:hypothetical protein
MHPNDRQERLISGHPGSKLHMRGKSLRQKHRDRILRLRKIREARVRTVAVNSGRILFDEGNPVNMTAGRNNG